MTPDEQNGYVYEGDPEEGIAWLMIPPSEIETAELLEAVSDSEGTSRIMRRVLFQRDAMEARLQRIGTQDCGTGHVLVARDEYNALRQAHIKTADENQKLRDIAREAVGYLDAKSPRQMRLASAIKSVLY